MASHLGSSSRFGWASSLLAYAAFGFLTAFISSWPYFPKTVNTGEPWLVISNNPLIQNILLFSLFPLQHSGLAFDPVRRFIKSASQDGTFEAIYATASSLVLITLCGCWTPIPNTIWSTVATPTLFYTITVLNLVIWFFLMMTVVITGPVDNRVSEFIRKWIFKSHDVQPGTLITSGPYAMCRHPIYALLFAAILVHPVMSIGHFMLASFFIIYAVMAVVFLEEPRLVREFSVAYKKYMTRVPRFVPGVKFL